MKVRELIKLLESKQWRQVRQKGSHRAFRHPVKALVVTVPGSRNDDIPVGYAQVDSQEGRDRGPMKRYAVVFEKADKNWAAYVPDLPGCITTGKTLDETKQNIREAVELHLEAMREVGDPIPEPTADVDFVELQTVA